MPQFLVTFLSQSSVLTGACKVCTMYTAAQRASASDSSNLSLKEDKLSMGWNHVDETDLMEDEVTCDTPKANNAPVQPVLTIERARTATPCYLFLNLKVPATGMFQSLSCLVMPQMSFTHPIPYSSRQGPDRGSISDLDFRIGTSVCAKKQVEI